MTVTAYDPRVVEYYTGVAADTKPTTASVGAQFYETDTGYNWIFDGSAWSKKLYKAA